MDFLLIGEDLLRRVSILEGQFGTMQNQMMGMQATLERILNVIQGSSGPAPPPPPPHGSYAQHNGPGGNSFNNMDSNVARQIPPPPHMSAHQPHLDGNLQMISTSGPPPMSNGSSASPQSTTQPMSAQSFFLPGPPGIRPPPNRHHHVHDDSSSTATISGSTPQRTNSFPPLPGFAPPVSRISTWLTDL